MSACAFTTPIAPGPGRVGDVSKKRLAEAQVAATRARTEQTCRIATATGELRGLLKCSELTLPALAQHDPAAVELARPALAKLEVSDDACEALPGAARAWTALDQFEKAAQLEVKTATQCQSAPAAIRAAVAFNRAQRCDDVFTICKAGWAWQKNDREQVGLMDQVARCSDAYTLDENLAFVPAESLKRYRLLLATRAEKQKQQEERDRLDELAHVAELAANQSRIEAETRKGQCAAECSKTKDQCQAACGGDMTCHRRCEGKQRACESVCR